jgi:hypothetical protein
MLRAVARDPPVRCRRRCYLRYRQVLGRTSGGLKVVGLLPTPTTRLRGGRNGAATPPQAAYLRDFFPYRPATAAYRVAERKAWMSASKATCGGVAASPLYIYRGGDVEVARSLAGSTLTRATEKVADNRPGELLLGDLKRTCGPARNVASDSTPSIREAARLPAAYWVTRTCSWPGEISAKRWSTN